MNNFQRFQALQMKRRTAQKEGNAKFIFQGYPSTLISCGEINYQAAVVNEQEKDKAYVYTRLDNVLDIGSVWTAKNLHLLISEEITIVKNVNFRKYLALLANIEVANTWGYFKGPEERYVGITLRDNVVLESLQKPILVLPANILGFEDKIVINGRGWLVQEYDAISTPGLIYYSLRPTTVSKEELDAHSEYAFIEHKNEEPLELIENPIIGTEDLPTLVSNNVNITLSTEDGYFTYSNKNIKIVKRSSSLVVFYLPFGVNEVTVATKSNGEIITKTYKQGVQ